MSAKAELIAARKLIETPEKWYQGGAESRRMITDEYGSRRQVRCFCTIGALWSATGTINIRPSTQALLSELSPDASADSACGRIAKWNDAPERTHAEVLALYDRAIERVS